MSKKHLIWILFTALILLTAAGCAPECTEGELDHEYAYNLQPQDEGIVASLTPTLSWSWNEPCNPHRFVIGLFKDSSGPVEEFEVSGSQTEYAITTPLDPGSKYNWSIYTTLSNQFVGPTSNEHTFYTEPLCSGAPTVAPILDSPEDGEFVTPNHWPYDIEFHWHYSGACLPTSFLYEFASDPNFQNIIVSGETQNHSQFIALSFPDCTTIYWHVAAKNGSQAGPFSATQSFSWIEDPNCWMNHYPSDDVGRIRGRVYLDLCPQTKKILGVNEDIVDGCIQTQGFGITANGDIDYNYGAEFKPDPGLKNVVVNLGEGTCPSATILDQDVTGSSGKFSFTVLTPGTYCLSVSKDQNGYQVETATDFNLMHGLWTEPLTHALQAEYTVTYGEGWHDEWYNFGWDEYDAFLFPFPIEKIWCRRIPFHWCDPLHLFEIGDTAPMLARNEKGTWIKSSVQGEICYFYNSPENQEMVPYSLGMDPDEYINKFNALEVFDPVPPCPTPTPTPRPKPVSPDDPCAGKSQRDCIADSKCTWVYSAAAGYCTKK